MPLDNALQTFKKEKKTFNKYGPFEDMQKHPEKFSLNFSSCNRYPSWLSAAKDSLIQFTKI